MHFQHHGPNLNTRILLIFLVLTVFVFGLLNAILNGHFRASQPWHLIEQLSLVTLAYWWYYNDKHKRQFTSNRWLNIGVVALWIIAIPIYLFRSRGAKGGAIAFTFFVLFSVTLVVVWSIGVAVGRYELCGQINLCAIPDTHSMLKK